MILKGNSLIALWFNRGMGPKSQGIISANFSLVCIGVVCQGGSVTIKLSPGLNHQYAPKKKNKTKIEIKILNPSPCKTIVQLGICGKSWCTEGKAMVI